MFRMIMIGLAAAFGAAGSLALIGFAIAPQLFEEPPNLYRGANFRFELPRGWKCVLEETEWVCQTEEKGTLRKAAIIIFALKIRNNTQDKLDLYEEYLRKPKKLSMPDGKVLLSKVIHVRRIKQGPHTWVDSKHFESEIPGFYTRYLATTTSHYGIAVTYSVARDYLSEIEPQLQEAFESLKINQRY